MTPLEWLLLCFVIVEIVQVHFLLRNNVTIRRTIHDIIHDPEYAAAVAQNMMFGFMREVANDEEKQKAFFGFVGVCMQQAVRAIPGINALDEGKPIKTGWKPLDGVLNIPAIRDKLAAVVTNKIERSIEGGADKAADQLIGWGT